VNIVATVRSDMTAAMKAAQRDRAGALRLVLAELQRAEKEGGDPVAVLRRERKRREESAATYREAGRDELARQEAFEAEVIAGYLPAELSDDDLAEIVRQAVAETGAEGPHDMGRVMKAAMGQVAGRADGRRVSAQVKEALGALHA
jgi:uncharacterized protein YqeY